MGSIPGLPESEYTGTIDPHTDEIDISDAAWVEAALELYLEEGVGQYHERLAERINRLREHFGRLGREFDADGRHFDPGPELRLPPPPAKPAEPEPWLPPMEPMTVEALLVTLGTVRPGPLRRRRMRRFVRQQEKLFGKRAPRRVHEFIGRGR